MDYKILLNEVLRAQFGLESFVNMKGMFTWNAFKLCASVPEPGVLVVKLGVAIDFAYTCSLLNSPIQDEV